MPYKGGLCKYGHISLVMYIHVTFFTLCPQWSLAHDNAGCHAGQSQQYLYVRLLEVPKQETCIKRSYNDYSNQFCITTYSSYMSLLRKIVAASAQPVSVCVKHLYLK